MTNDDQSPKDEQFDIGLSNPIMESASDHGDSQDSGVKFLGYKPLNTEKQPGEKGDWIFDTFIDLMLRFWRKG